ncbi:MAG: UDP-glucose/GDP-mannose dehydrogenase family protein [Microgenomates group bacterium GW2011_GWA1_48_10]|nr:MAG: UDP-glucose/GDP-mannose dehydrogenase family protein [Microgenomates group bacterium GW2011_GWA1_48_10]
MTTIGIVGFGYVGKAVEYGFRPKNKIVVHDKFLPSEPLENVVSNSDIVFVCVPTPMDGKYSRIDLSIVESVVGETVGLARKLGRKPIITIKSTVIPGTTRNLGKKFDWPEILFNPEFLTETNYLQDFIKSDRIVIGGDVNWVRAKLVDLYRDSFPLTTIFETDPTTAEMVKYMANTFLAAKVIFANEMFDLCEQLGIKYEEMKKMVVADYRIFDSHLDITTQRGFGGKCFPKDTVALLGLARELGVELSVLETAWKKNLKIRKVRDWEEIPGAVSRKQRKQGESNT